MVRLVTAYTVTMRQRRLADTAGDLDRLGGVREPQAGDAGDLQGRISTRPETRIFTTSHFDGYPAVLVRLDRVAMPELEELLVEAWLTRAPRRLAAEYLDAARNHARPERCPLATL
jgi:hypothetical protein